MTFENLLDRINTPKKLEFGDILGRSIDLFKKVWVEGFVHLILMFAIMIPVIIAAYVPLIGLFGFQYLISGGREYPASQEFDPTMLPMMIGMVLVMLLVIAVMNTFSMALMAHFYQVCKKADTGTTTETGGYFSYLSNGGFKKLLVLSFATFGIAVAAALLCYIPLFYVAVPLTLLQVIFSFNRELSVKQIITASFKLGNKHWLLTFGLMIIAGIIAYLGIIACFIGLFFTIMFAYIPPYYIYKDSVGFETDKDEVIEYF